MAVQTGFVYKEKIQLSSRALTVAHRQLMPHAETHKLEFAGYPMA